MAKLTIPKMKEEAREMKLKLLDEFELGAPGLVGFVDRVKSQGARVVFHNGDRHVAVGQTFKSNRVISGGPASILAPNGSLVLSSYLESSAFEQVYVGDSPWFIGAATLALALETGEDSMLDVVTSAASDRISRNLSRMIIPIVVNPGDYHL